MHKLTNRFWFARWSGQCDVRGSYQVAPELVIADLTHEIEPYNIHDASYRLAKASPIGQQEPSLFQWSILA